MRAISATVVVFALGYVGAGFVYAQQAGAAPTAGAKGVTQAFTQWCNRTVGTPVACTTLSCRTNNSGAQVCGGTQGNITSAISKQFGAVGCHSNNNTSIFPTRVHGLAAHAALLRNYCGKQGRCTPSTVTSKWATGAQGTYATLVAKITGISENQVFNPNDPDTIGKLVTAMSRMEAGRFAHPCNEIAQGVAAAFGAVGDLPTPGNIGAVLAGAGGTAALSGLIEGNTASGQLFNNIGQQYSGFQPWNGNSNPAAAVQQQAQQAQQAAESGQSSPQADPNAGLLEALKARDAQQQAQQPFAAFTKTELGVDDGVETMLTCDNNVVEWSCDTGAALSRGISKPKDTSFKTEGALVGSLQVSPTAKTEYTVQCLQKQRVVSEGSCVVYPKKKRASSADTKPVLTIEADSPTVNRGKSVLISWAAVKVDSCVVYGEGLSEEGLEGSVTTDDLFTRGTANYVLECRTLDGETITRSVDVEVR
jgi:hypothetical protein